MNSLDFETLGLWIVSIFIISWLVSIAVYRYKKIEDTVS